MAEAALFNVADWVLNQLGSKLLQQASLLWGIEDDVSKLTRTFSTIQALLLDADQKSSSSSQTHQLQLWLKELSEVVYDAQDLLDDFNTEMRRRRQTSGSQRISKEVTDFFSSSNQISYGLQIAHGIREIRARIDEIAERGSMFNLLEYHPVVDDRKEREQTHSGVPHVVIGRETDKENIVKLLLSSISRDKFSVVPIVGIGGLGKTTLAQLVYNDGRVKSHYEVAAWVCVSENFDVKLIVEKIIGSCTGKRPEGNLEMDSLRKRLHEIISGKTCLVVLDDVWNQDREKWSRLKSLLMCGGGKGSCSVMITTRLKKVARLANTRKVEPYELKGLSENEAWSLFREMAFAGGEVTSVKHERIGREIVEKCKGVPLAVRTIAGALLFRETESEWAEFRSKEIWEMDQDESDIMPTLKLSYDNLPTHLKHCFAYCRLFPKDYEMNVKQLIQLWIAQGYVSSSDLPSQYNVGLEYFKDLLWRSFFQEVTQDEWGNLVYCKMHDLMHDLAVAVAGKESVTLHVSSLPDDVDIIRIRHVSLAFKVMFLEELCQVSSLIVNNADKLRTFFVIRKPLYCDRWTMSDVPIAFSNTTSLRVLDLSFFKIMVISQTIYKLKHLRYLDLSGNNMTTLPEEITWLLNLEVLMLEECRLLEKLPKGTGDLSNLSHLALGGCPALICLPLGIGQLCYLRELSEFLLAEGDQKCNSNAAAGIGELRYLNNLRGKLMIQNLERVNDPSEGETANLREKQYLEQLLLSWESGRDNADVVAEGKLLEALRPHPNLKMLTLSCNAGLKCPSWLPCVTNLVEIRLEESPNWTSLPPLDQLPFLAKLELSCLYSLEYISSAASSIFFPSLEYLELKSCPKLKGWLTPEGVLPQFPCVSEVTIGGCYGITSIPHFSLHLQHLTFSGGSKELLNQILRIIPSSSPPCSSRLEHLDISEVMDLDTLPENLLLRLSSSMKELCISDCPELRTLSPALPNHLTSLKKLDIYGCEELDLCDHETKQLDSIVLPRLSSINFNGIRNLTSLPDWLQQAPNLKEIKTRDCPIQCIPEWMPKLSELELLEMRQWGRSVAECITEDWPKIAHIRTIVLDKVCVKKDGFRQPFNDEMEEEDGWDTVEVLGLVIQQRWGPEEEVGGGEETSKLVQFSRNCSSRLSGACNIFCRCFQA